MKLLSKIVIAITVLLSTTIAGAQIKNAKTESIKIYGNCGMCETKIEKAGNLKNIANVDWNKDTNLAILTYDATKTNPDEILKRIALVGYDSDKFLAPAETYSKLDKCCQYDREAKIAVNEEPKNQMSGMDMANHSTMTETQVSDQLSPIFDNYFALKDALVKTDGNTASVKASALLSAINAVKMGELKMDVHMVWMKVLENLKKDATAISTSTDTKKQRDSFDTLSVAVYELIKVSKTDAPIYYQRCPMANYGKGADWLSKENTIKNPYFGSMMLSCGKTVETIK